MGAACLHPHTEANERVVPNEILAGDDLQAIHKTLGDPTIAHSANPPFKPRNHQGTTEWEFPAISGKYSPQARPDKQAIFQCSGSSRKLGNIKTTKLWIRRSAVRVHPAYQQKSTA
jgi:hypothetical protein